MESVFQYLQTAAVESDLQMRGHVSFRQQSYSRLRGMGLVLHIVGSAWWPLFSLDFSLGVHFEESGLMALLRAWHTCGGCLVAHRGLAVRL